MRRLPLLLLLLSGPTHAVELAIGLGSQAGIWSGLQSDPSYTADVRDILPTTRLDFYPIPRLSFSSQFGFRSDASGEALTLSRINTGTVSGYPLLKDTEAGWLRAGVEAGYSSLYWYIGTYKINTASGGVVAEVGRDSLAARLNTTYFFNYTDWTPKRGGLALGLSLHWYPVHQHASMSGERAVRAAARDQEKAEQEAAKQAQLAEEEAARQGEEAARQAALEAEEARQAEEASRQAPSASPAASGGPALVITSGRLAVLELSSKTLSGDELGVLTDTVRGGVISTVGSELTVMTRENMEVMLTDMGLDADCIAEGACEVETARNLGVDYVVSGNVVQMGTSLVASVKLHDVQSGQLLATDQATASDAIGLMNTLKESTARMLEQD